MKEGYLEPNLKYPLVGFENSLAPKELKKATKKLKVLETVSSTSDMGAESLPLPSIAESRSITLVQPYDLPTQSWPMSVLELPQNMCHTQEVHDRKKGPLKNAIQLSLKLPSKRVLIVVFSEIIPPYLIDLIEEIRGDRSC